MKLAMDAYENVSKELDPVLEQIEAVFQKRLHYGES